MFEKCLNPLFFRNFQFTICFDIVKEFGNGVWIIKTDKTVDLVVVTGKHLFQSPSFPSDGGTYRFKIRRVLCSHIKAPVCLIALFYHTFPVLSTAKTALYLLPRWFDLALCCRFPLLLFRRLCRFSAMWGRGKGMEWVIDKIRIWFIITWYIFIYLRWIFRRRISRCRKIQHRLIQHRRQQSYAPQKVLQHQHLFLLASFHAVEARFPAF